MIKYILVGGYDHKAEDGGKALCEEIIKGFAEPVKLLVCLFARPKETWPEKFEQEKKFFTQNLPGRHVDFRMAEEEKFLQQLEWADCIYFRGGRTQSLLDTLKNAGQWQDQLEGKTVAGSSAGAHMLAKYSYSPDDLKLNQGLGILNIKVLTHYQSDFNAPNVDWDKAYKELDDFGEKLELITLHEGEFRVIEQE